MARTNFTKVEEAIDAGLRKLTVEHLLHLTEKGAKEGALTREQTALILLFETERLYRKDSKVFKKLGIKGKELKKLLSKPDELEEKEWKQIEKIQNKLKTLAEKIDEEFPDATDDELIESERHKHINKRFNVNDGWLPLK